MREEEYMAKREALIQQIQANQRRHDDKAELARQATDPGLKAMYDVEARKAQEQVEKYEHLKDELDTRFDRNQ